jgi:hypothetical protein
VKSVIAKVTGQSEYVAADEANSFVDCDDSLHNRPAGVQDRARTREITARVRALTSSAGLAGSEIEEAIHSDSDSDAQSSSGSVSKWKSQPCCRIDFELDSSVLEGISETIGIIRSHFCYWDHRNVAALIVTLMHSPPPLSGDDETGLVNFGSLE